jgi:ubiquitin-like protein Pup
MKIMKIMNVKRHRHHSCQRCDCSIGALSLRLPAPDSRLARLSRDPSLSVAAYVRAGQHLGGFMSQVHAQKTPQTREDEPAAAPEPVAQDSAMAVSAASDDILDEIDGILEENAELFVSQYIQKGGQ